jgi:hypothetical protein
MNQNIKVLTRNPKILEAALTDAGVSMENLRTDVSRAIANLALFQPKEGNNSFGGPWIRDVIAPGHEVGETWCAIISAPDGKSYEVDFTIADKSVTISGEPREVIQQVTYETVPVADAAEAASSEASAGGTPAVPGESANLIAFEGASMVEAPTSKSAWDGFMAMAGGVQTITLGCMGHPLIVTIDVNEAGAKALQAQLLTVSQNSKQRAFNCFDHGGTKGRTEASSWPKKFWWGKKNGSEGIMEAAEPSDTGTAAINGKRYRGFSLTFFTDAEVKKSKLGVPYIEAGARGSEENPAQIICHPLAAEQPEAFLNMGTLTNRPAVVANEPLFAATPSGVGSTVGAITTNNSPPASAAARTAGAPTKTSKPTVMEKTQLDAAALQERCGQLETKIAELTASDAAANRLELRALNAELEANQANLTIAKQNETIVQLQASETKRKETEADAAVTTMIHNQQIPMLDKELQASWKKKFIADPTLIPLTVKAKGPNGRVTPGGTATAMTAALGYGDVNEGPIRIYRHMSELCKRQMRAFGMEAADCKLRSDTAKEFALVYRKEIRGQFDADGCPTMKPEFMYAPISEAVPLEAAADTDTLGTLVGTLVTQRTLDLFKYKFPLISRIMTDMSDQPSDLNQAVSTRKVLVPAVQTFDTVLDTDGYPKGWDVASAAQTTDINITLDELVGVPIPFSMAALSSAQRQLFGEQSEAQVYALIKYFLAKIYAVCTAANFNAYVAVTAADAQGVIRVPTAYDTYKKAMIDFARSSAAELGVAFDANEVPEEMRTLLLNAQYYGKATQDPSIVTFFAGQQAPGIITDGKLPNLSGFVPVKAPNFPGTNNRVGMALQKNGLLAKSRLPANLMDVFPGAGNGTSTQVTDLDTGFTAMMVRYIDNRRGFAAQLLAAILGAAKGDVRGGLVITLQ